MKPKIQIVDLADLIQIVYAVGCNYLQEVQDQQQPTDPQAEDWSISSARRYVHMLLSASLENSRAWKIGERCHHNAQTPLMFLVSHLCDEDEIDSLEEYFDNVWTMIHERLMDHIGDDDWMDWNIQFIDDYTVLYPRGDRRVLYFEHLYREGLVTWETLNTFDE